MESEKGQRCSQSLPLEQTSRAGSMLAGGRKSCFFDLENVHFITRLGGLPNKPIKDYLGPLRPLGWLFWESTKAQHKLGIRFGSKSQLLDVVFADPGDVDERRLQPEGFWKAPKGLI